MSTERRHACRILCRNLKERDALEDSDLESRVIVKWVLGRKTRRPVTGVISLTTWASAMLA
jgi:hypothetical protein